MSCRLFSFASFASCAVLAAFAASACTSTPREIRGSALEHGRALFDDPRASSSKSNAFTCATCHPSENPEKNDRVFPGASLGGATARKSFWGGRRLDLLEAVNDCRLLFMDARVPWTADDEDARAMYGYLAALPVSGKNGEPRPFTLSRAVRDLPRGSRAAGERLYAAACQTCHGTAHDGVGRKVTFAPILPDAVDRSHAALTPIARRIVYLRKIRKGAFIATSGAMPPFSEETLSEDDLGSILTFLGQY